MKKTLRLFPDNKYFFLSYTIALIAGFITYSLLEKGEFLLWLNGNHNAFLDVFFKYATFMGDGLFIGILLIPFALYRYGLAFESLLAYVFSGLVAQIIKRTLELPRPKVWFENHDILHFVAGVSVYSSNSFPSGHTATAFALFTLLAISTKNKLYGILYFILALIVGLSRVYLLQHFLLDILVGSIIGTVSSLILYSWLSNSKWYQEKKWPWKSLTGIAGDNK